MNFNQNNTGYSQQSTDLQFSGPQAVFQPGFSNTDAQQIRQQNGQSSQNQGYGYFHLH